MSIKKPDFLSLIDKIPWDRICITEKHNKETLLELAENYACHHWKIGTHVSIIKIRKHKNSTTTFNAFVIYRFLHYIFDMAGYGFRCINCSVREFGSNEEEVVFAELKKMRYDHIELTSD